MVTERPPHKEVAFVLRPNAIKQTGSGGWEGEAIQKGTRASTSPSSRKDLGWRCEGSQSEGKPDDAVSSAVMSYLEIIFTVQGNHCNALSMAVFPRVLWLLCVS